MNKIEAYITDIALDRERGPLVFIFSPLLLALSWVYGLVVLLIRSFCRSGVLPVFRAPVPVISVGNITAGGTGKTPFVAMLCELLISEGHNPMVLTRGFKADGHGRSDEAEMLKEIVGQRVFAGPDRVAGFHAAIKAGHFDCVVLDDGFQQWRFERDLDIVLIDSRKPFGNGTLIPRGVMREPRGALGRAGMLVLTRSDRINSHEMEQLKSVLKRIAPKAVQITGIHRIRRAREAVSGVEIDLVALKGPAAAFCAIADPDSFRRTLQGQGIDLRSLTVFRDHHLFTRAEISAIVEVVRREGLLNVFVTHKDMVKLKELADVFEGLKLMVIDVELELAYGKTELISIIRRLLRS